MLRIVFCGSPQFAAISLRYLLECPCELIGVVTMPDKKQGRGQKIKFNPVKTIALDNKIALFQPDKATDTNFLRNLAKLKPDLIVVVAYGKILRRQFLDIPKYGCVNLHSSYLPKYRGASPIHWALLNGDNETGVTTFLIDEGMDTGDIILRRRIPIEPDDTLGTLHDKLAYQGARLLWDTIVLFEKGMPPTYKQPEDGVSYSAKITPDLSIIDWRRSAYEIHNLVRALNPIPGARTTIPVHDKKQSIKIFKTSFSSAKPTVVPGVVVSVDKDSFSVACGDGILRVTEVQLAGKTIMSTATFLRGHAVTIGIKLGT